MGAVGQALGVCRERVRQLEAEVAEKLLAIGGPLALELLQSLEDCRERDARGLELVQVGVPRRFD